MNGGYCGCGNNVVIFVCVVMLVRGGDKVENRCHLGVVDVRCIWQFRKIVKDEERDRKNRCSK